MLSLGTGGPNRLGQSRYVSRRGIDRLIRHALDLGINLFDTSDAYEQSEVLLGDALRGVPRDRYFLSGKLFPWQNGRLMGPREVRGLVERSLRRLRTHELDLLQLHRVTPEDYESARDHVLPELEDLREEGKVRFLGITESTSRDPQHRMALRALRDDAYDTIMVAYHPANMLAEQQVFPRALARDVGVIAMAAARHLVPRNRSERLQVLARTLASLLYSPPRDRSRLKARLQEAYADAVQSGPPKAEPVGRPGGASPLQLPEAVYTFAVSQQAVSSALTGTTNPTHLERNVAAVLAPALTPEEAARLRALMDS